MTTKDDTQHNLIGIKLSAIMIGNDTHEIAAIAHMLIHGRPNLAHFDVKDLRRSLDKLKVTIADMDRRLEVVENIEWARECARQMEVA